MTLTFSARSAAAASSGNTADALRAGTKHEHRKDVPSAADLLGGLTAIANDHLVAALVWHIVIGFGLVAAFLGWRPSPRVTLLFFGGLTASVSASAVHQRNPFNGLAFGLLTLVLLIESGRHTTTSPGRPPWLSIQMGAALIAFGWFYPHFLQSQSMFMYAVAAPTGLIPCPTLAVMTGVTLLAQPGLSRRWSILLGAFGLFYGAFGVLRLGVFLDIVLLIGALYLLAMALFHTTPLPNER